MDRSYVYLFVGEHHTVTKLVLIKLYFDAFLAYDIIRDRYVNKKSYNTELYVLYGKN